MLKADGKSFGDQLGEHLDALKERAAAAHKLLSADTPDPALLKDAAINLGTELTDLKAKLNREVTTLDDGRVVFTRDLLALKIFAQANDISPAALFSAIGTVVDGEIRELGMGVTKVHLRDFSSLKALTGLRELGLVGNFIDDTKGLSELTSIEKLNLSYTNLTDLDFLAPLKRLKVLILVECRVANHLGGLRNFPDLKYLDLKGCSLTSCNLLPQMPALRRLWLNRNSMSDLAGLSQAAPALTYLEAIDCGLTSIAGVEGLSQLESAFFYRNKLKDVTPLKDKKRLKYLHLNRNHINKWREDLGLAGLETLNLGGNPLTNIEGVKFLPGLSTLILPYEYGTHARIEDVFNHPAHWLKNIFYRRIKGAAGLLELTNLKGIVGRQGLPPSVARELNERGVTLS